MKIAALLSCACLASCAPQRPPEEAIQTALSYTELKWLPEARHIRHGKDLEGITVHTPDTTLAAHGDVRGWWQPGVPAKGMAYKWGGFDTPESFLSGLQNGQRAGDIAIAARVELYDHRVPQELYDLRTDPDCLHNLISESASLADAMRETLLQQMEATNDPQLGNFQPQVGLSRE